MEYSQMREGFIEEYLDYYQSTIRENYGLKITSVEDSEIIDDPITTAESGYGIKAFVTTMSRTFVPILLFIILLYSSMSIGTNVIAGQKERGTFTGILLTPLPRYAIILGYLGGVVIKTLIPHLYSHYFRPAGRSVQHRRLPGFIYLSYRSCSLHCFSNDHDIGHQRYRSIRSDRIPAYLPDPRCCLRHMYPVSIRERGFLLVPARTRTVLRHR